MGRFQGFAKVVSLHFLFCFFTLLLCDLSCADPPYPRCSNTSYYRAGGLFYKSLNNLLQLLPSNASISKFYNTSIGTDDTDRVYGLYMCLNYVTQETCHNCITTASQDILTLCSTSKEAIIWEELCQLRYSDNNFFSKLSFSDTIPLDNKKNISEPENFRFIVNAMLHNLTQVAAYDSGNMYATGEVLYMDGTVYAVVQCTLDLSPDDCNRCLGNATQEILDVYYFSIGARVLSRSCYLRYELYKFYEGATEDSSGSSPNNKKGQGSGEKRLKFALVAVVLACLIVAAFGSFAYYIAFNKGNKKRNNEIVRQTSLKHFHKNYPKDQDQFPYFDFASIVAATNNFSDSSKLGEGGFGPVYKGVLRDGREVAIKRLSICSEQGSEQFTNEVLLIMKLQHKNLVRLLGFCVDGEEKMLVYEYMPNNSLDVILFDRRRGTQLDWHTRINIINGIAKGTLYLHEDSRLRIVHRDLKASNILLDLDMNPKISDFGMAKIFSGTEGQANTATIVGTYGYMAPEYAMEGIYSVKSDVFSFGVLLLEIITGKRNAGFQRTNHRAPCLLSYAWHLWNEGQVLELVDPSVADSCNPDEFIRYLHIGLLCVQEDAYDRPTLSSVVVMLKGETTSLCQPKRPAFSTGRFKCHGESGFDNRCSVNGLTVSAIMPR